MKMLAIVAAAFLPMGIVVGAFGMNFDEIPGQNWAPAFYVVIAIMFLILVAVVAIFWYRGWFSWGNRTIIRSRPFQVAEEQISSYAGNLRFWVIDLPIQSGKKSLRLGGILNPLNWEKQPRRENQPKVPDPAKDDEAND